MAVEPVSHVASSTPIMGTVQSRVRRSRVCQSFAATERRQRQHRIVLRPGVVQASGQENALAEAVERCERPQRPRFLPLRDQLLYQRPWTLTLQRPARKARLLF